VRKFTGAFVMIWRTLSTGEIDAILSTVLWFQEDSFESFLVGLDTISGYDKI